MNLVTYTMLGAGMMPNYVEFLKADYILHRNHPNAMVWKDLGHDSTIGNEIPVNKTPPKSNGEIRIFSTVRRPGQLVSLMSHKSKSIYIRLTPKIKDSSDNPLHLYSFCGNLIYLYLKPANVKDNTQNSKLRICHFHRLRLSLQG